LKFYVSANVLDARFSPGMFFIQSRNDQGWLTIARENDNLRPGINQGLEAA
jgi:hypothetical protein